MNVVKKILNHPFLLASIIYLFTVLLINPFSEFAVNDDWDFYAHVRNFREGDFTKNSLIDSSFVLQGFVAQLWSYIFGFSYPSLKVLTVLITVLFLFGVNKILDLLETSPFVKILALLTVVFNPFIHVSSMTFMTEMYFLCTIVWGTYFVLKYNKTGNNKYFTTAVIISSLSVFSRQIGILFAPAVLVSGIYYDWKNLKKKKLNLRYLLYLITILGSAVLALLWPQYNSDNETPVDIILKSASSLTEIQRILNNLYYFLPYIGISVLPFGLYALLFSLPKRWRIGVFILTLITFMSFYKYDLFKLGNVLYPEALMIKSNYTHHVTAFNNIPFKLFLTTIVLLSSFSFISELIRNRKKIVETPNLILIFISSALIFPVLMHRGFYDRYIVNGGVLLVILAASLIPDIKKKTFIFLAAMFLVLYTFSLSQDYLTTTKIQWQYAEKLANQVQLKDKIFLNGSYTRFTSVFPRKNGPDIVRPVPLGIKYQCYVQKHTVPNKNNLFFKFFNRLDTSRTIEDVLGNPRPYDLELLPGYRLPPSNPEKIMYSQEYFSIPEILIGNKSYIVTYCLY